MNRVALALFTTAVLDSMTFFASERCASLHMNVNVQKAEKVPKAFVPCACAWKKPCA